MLAGHSRAQEVTVSRTLETARLRLAPMQASDFDHVCALWTDERFTRRVLPSPLTPEEVWLRLLRDIGHWQALGFGNWAVRLRDSGEFVGAVGVFDFRRMLEPALDSPELGWGVAPRFQNRGLAREALTAALDWCEGVLGAQRTVCIIHPENRPSHALAAKVGYRPYAETTYKDGPIVLLERRGPGGGGAPAS